MRNTSHQGSGIINSKQDELESHAEKCGSSQVDSACSMNYVLQSSPDGDVFTGKDWKTAEEVDCTTFGCSQLWVETFEYILPQCYCHQSTAVGRLISPVCREVGQIVSSQSSSRTLQLRSANKNCISSHSSLASNVLR